MIVIEDFGVLTVEEELREENTAILRFARV
jgi:hypothetical protein